MFGNIALIFLSLTLSTNAQRFGVPEFVVSTVISEPFLMKNPSSNAGGNDQFVGFIKEFADELFDKLGFAFYRLKIAGDGKYGVKNNETGTWSGMIGEVTTRRSDAALADLSMTAERAEAVQFSVPFMESRLAILLKTFRKGEIRTNDENAEPIVESDESQFPWFNPMTLWFWLTFIFASFLMLFLIFFTEKSVTRQISKVQPPPEETLFEKFTSRVFGSPKSIGTRFLQVTFWIFLLICFSAFTSNFAADRILDLVERSGGNEPLPVNSIDELAGNDKMQIGVLKHGSTYRYLQNSEDGLIKKLIPKLVEVDTYDAGMRRVSNSNGSFALLMDSSAAKYAIIRKPCKLAMASKLFGPNNGISVAIPKLQPRIDLRKLNAAILKMKEEGFVERLTDKWFKDQTECEDDGKGKIEIERKYNPLNLENMASFFILLTIVIIIVFIVAAIETMLNRKTEYAT